MLITLLCMAMSTQRFYAYDCWDKLNPQQQLKLSSVNWYILDGDMEGAYDRLCGPAWCAPDPIMVMELVDKRGYFTDKIDDLKAKGLLPQDYTYSGGKSTSTAASTTPATPKEFTVEDIEPYTAWVKSDVNVREGADTSWGKIGGLKQYDEVTVTGKASTGWYRIKTDTIETGYASDKFFTTEDPRNRTVPVYNPNEDAVETYTFTDTDPEIIDAAVEQIREEIKEATPEPPHEHEYKSEVTTEATCNSVGTITYTCDCGDTYTKDIPFTDHTPGEWEITRQPTWTKTGMQVQKCTVCGKTLNEEELPANPMPLYIIIGVVCLAGVAGVIGFTVKARKR